MDRAAMAGGRRWGIAVGIFFTVLLVPVGYQILHDDSPGPRRTAALVLLIAYGISYLIIPSWLWQASHAKKLAAAMFLVTIGVAFVAVQGLGSMPLLGYAIAVAAIMLPLRWSAPIAALLVVGFGAATLAHADPPWASWSALFTISVDLVLMGMLINTNKALHRARHELATHAVSDERARVARDLHDVLGHTLTSLSVKAALARRLLDKGMTEQAAQELAAIEHHARETLAEVRATVSGYREASLAAEIAGARVALEAGQIAAEITGDPDEIPAHLRETFAFVVREGVTNVIRHSSAQTCRIVVGPSSVEITDDGGHPLAPRRAGNGLAGLAQRLAAVGGSLTSGPHPDGGFSIRAVVGESR
jgi:two-component system sensor histidine kinase DesK